VYGIGRLSSVLHLFQAFPAISTGIYSYPIESATRVALEEIRKFLDTEQAKEACLVQVAMLRNMIADHVGLPPPTV
jgi:O-acetyl-ADP-ribose deacetylase (regulator of RNase III)